jgi:hypothetical protein
MINELSLLDSVLSLVCRCGVSFSNDTMEKDLCHTAYIYIFASCVRVRSNGLRRPYYTHNICLNYKICSVRKQWRRNCIFFRNNNVTRLK